MDKKTVTYSFKASLPVMAGYMVLGIGFGIIVNSYGYPWYLATLMSVFIFAGSMQYVGIDLIASGANLITFALMTLVVNGRHLFYGLAILDKYKDLKKTKPYCIFALSDETFSLVCDNSVPDDIDKKLYYFLVSLFDQSYWVIGSTVGALIGAAFTFNSAGVEFSMTALFTVVFIENWDKSDNHIPAIVGIIVPIICIFIFGAGSFLIPALLIITAVLLIIGKDKINEAAND